MKTKRLGLLLSLVVWCSVMAAQVVVFNPTEDKSGSDDVTKQVMSKHYNDIADDITVRMDWIVNGSNGDPALNSYKNVYKFYQSGQLTISSKNRNILGIVLVRSTTGGKEFVNNKVSSDVGNVSSFSKDEVMWTGNSQEVQLTNNSNVVWLSEIRVTVDAFPISESGCATLYLPNSFRMPDGVQGHTIVVDNGEIKKTRTYKSGDDVRAETPLLIEGPKGTYVYTPLDNTATYIPNGDNDLMGSSDGKEIKNTGFGSAFYYYKLSYRSEEDKTLGFYWGVEGGKSVTVPAGRCCLRVKQSTDTSSAAKGFTLANVINKIGGVKIEESSCGDGKIYSINGVYVGDDSTEQDKGLYIQNGRKIVIK